MAMDDDLLIIEDDADITVSNELVLPWTLLVVDDEPEVHRVTKLALRNFTFEGRGLEILSAYSAEEARWMMLERLDIAVVLLDVVMESDDAGLKLVDWIRKDWRNHRIRVVLRTGQPGKAPERSVIIDYDINDYRPKTELTADRLFTTMVAVLRSYRDLETIERSRRGLEKVIEASGSLFETKSLDKFFAGILEQIDVLLTDSVGSLLFVRALDDKGMPHDSIRVIAGSGRFAIIQPTTLDQFPEYAVREAVKRAVMEKTSGYADGHCAVFFQARGNFLSIIYSELSHNTPMLDPRLIDLFCSKASIAFDNVLLFQQVSLAQESTVTALARLAEFKDSNTGGHILRVRDLVKATAEELHRRGQHKNELDDTVLEKIGLASVLHDVGKVAVPDAILMKPGPLDQKEWEIMRKHATAGSSILDEASRRILGKSFLSIGAEIAECHHEKWDGTGYPRGLKGTNIPLTARICAVADVYDALVSKRPYKNAWDKSDARQYVADRSGTEFDPDVVSAFLKVLDRFAEGEADVSIVTKFA